MKVMDNFSYIAVFVNNMVKHQPSESAQKWIAMCSSLSLFFNLAICYPRSFSKLFRPGKRKDITQICQWFQ